MFGTLSDPTDKCSKQNIMINDNVVNIQGKDTGNIDDDYDVGF